MALIFSNPTGNVVFFANTGATGEYSTFSYIYTFLSTGSFILQTGPTSSPTFGSSGETTCSLTVQRIA